MKNKYLFKTLTTVFALSLGVSVAHAKVAPEEAQKLGNELNCVGGEMSGNADGSIPPFTGEYVGKLPGSSDYTPHIGMKPVDPFASDTPQFMITGANWRDYADNLSEGQQLLFKRYPDKYKIPVYEGKRIFRYADKVCDVVKRNALEAQLDDKGLAYSGYKGGVPFPIPSGAEQGLQAFFNNAFAHLAYTEVKEKSDIIEVSSNGKATWGQTSNSSLNVVTSPEEMGKPMEGYMAYANSLTNLPVRDQGGRILTYEPVDYGMQRLVWSYNPGTRRVRQYPEYGFDSTSSGTNGKLTVDQDRLFNGSPIRYNWTLKGKREMYVPANTHRMHAKNVTYDALLQPQEAIPNSDFMRYELRRVWVLEANLKDDYRHKYGKRVMYLDEDSWHAVMSDYSDTRGQLTQHAILNYYYSPDTSAFQAGTSFYYDLVTGGYVAYNLFQGQEKGPILNAGGLTPEMYTPATLRASGF